MRRRRRGVIAGRLGRWAVAITASLLINGLFLAGLAWRDAEPRYAEPPTVEITLLRPEPDRPPLPPQPAQPAPASRQPQGRAPAAATPLLAGSTAAEIGPSLPAAPAPAPTDAGPGPTAVRPLNVGCLGRSLEAMTAEERARCQRQMAAMSAGVEPVPDRPALGPGAARQFGQAEADRDAWEQYRECEMRPQGNLEKNPLSCADRYPGLRSLFRRVFGEGQ